MTHKDRIEILKAAKDVFKAPFCFPGGYTKRVYFTDGGTVCNDCLLENWASVVNSTLHDQEDGWQVMGVNVHWEGPDDYCDQCGKKLPSEYGDPDNN